MSAHIEIQNYRKDRGVVFIPDTKWRIKTVTQLATIGAAAKIVSWNDQLWYLGDPIKTGALIIFAGGVLISLARWGWEARMRES